MAESIDPDDLMAPTLAMARTNPEAYAYRFSRVRPEAVRRWLHAAPAEALRIHSEAMRHATGRGLDIAARITVTGAEWHVRAFPDVDEHVAPERAVERLAAVRQLAAAVGVELALTIDIALGGLWSRGAAAEAALLAHLVPNAVEHVNSSPVSERGEPATGFWWCRLVTDIPALRLRDVHAELASGRTMWDAHDATIAEVADRAAALASELGVAFRPCDR